jgi:hypothetical protein
MKRPPEAPYNIRIAPNKTKNPVMADPRHILSNVAMTPLPMPSHGSNNNDRARLRFPSGSRLKNQLSHSAFQIRPLLESKRE